MPIEQRKDLKIEYVESQFYPDLALWWNDEVKTKVFKNMSKRAAEILRDDIASKGPVRLSEVEQAQKEILAVVLRLSEEGTIMLAGGGDEFV